MNIYNPAEILITDTNGRTFVVSPLSFSDRERFRAYLNELLNIVKEEEDRRISFVDLYDSNIRCNTICRLIFDLHKLDIKDISSDMLFSMLFPTSDDQDMGILAQVNALKPSSVDRDSVKEVKDAYHSLLAQLVELTGSIEEATKAFTNVPAATLLSTMNALGEIRRATDPEAQKEDLKEKAKQKILELQQQRAKKQTEE